MAERVMGVLGGMGPEATVAFLARVVALTPAVRDQDHLRVVVDCNPKIPDRTTAIQGRGPSPLPMLAASVEALGRAGAEFIAIPCVSAHAFIDELVRLASLPILSILDVVATGVASDRRGYRTVGLLGTSGTIEAGLFERRLVEAGLDVVRPRVGDQRLVGDVIYRIKADLSPATRRASTRTLRAVATRLVASGAQAVVLGCTELPLVLGPSQTRVPLFDSLEMLARAAVREAGREPRSAGAGDAAGPGGAS